MSLKPRKPIGVELGDGTLHLVGEGIRHYATIALGFLVMLLGVVLWGLLNGSPGYEEPSHGRTAVCGDGTILEPPWNSCGKEHGYLDHWTTGPAPAASASAATQMPETSVLEPGLSAIPTPEVCVDANARGVIPRDRWTPCGQLLGYFDDWATPPPGAPGVITEP